MTSGSAAVLVSFQETLLVIGVITFVDVAILIAWNVFAPLEWKRTVLRADIFGEALESQGMCTGDSWQVFASLIGCLHLFLLALGCVLCYKARQIPTMFQEGKYVSIAMLSNLQIFIVGGR